MSEKKLAGLWIDRQKAIVVTNHDSQDVSEFKIAGTIETEVKDPKFYEQAANSAENKLRVQFFKEVGQLITNSEELFITGPGISQEELKNYLLETPQFKNLKIELGVAEKMDENNVLKEVIHHYS